VTRERCDLATILIVDDDQIILGLSEELVNLLGYETYTAQNGDAALEMLSSKGEEIDLVILDISLPDINGLALFPILLAKRPNIKIILTSGNMLEDLEDSGGLLQQKGIVGFLQKPYELDVLKSTLERVLNLS